MGSETQGKPQENPNPKPFSRRSLITFQPVRERKSLPLFTPAEEITFPVFAQTILLGDSCPNFSVSANNLYSQGLTIPIQPSGNQSGHRWTHKPVRSPKTVSGPDLSPFFGPIFRSFRRPEPDLLVPSFSHFSCPKAPFLSHFSCPFSHSPNL